MKSNPFDRISFRAAIPTDRSRPPGEIRQGSCPPRDFQTAVTTEEDKAYADAIEAGDLDTVLRLMKRAERKSDMLAQAAWLLRQAIAAGYRSVDHLLQADEELFEILADAWRRAHPATR